MIDQDQIDKNQLEATKSLLNEIQSSLASIDEEERELDSRKAILDGKREALRFLEARLRGGQIPNHSRMPL